MQTEKPFNFFIKRLNYAITNKRTNLRYSYLSCLILSFISPSIVTAAPTAQDNTNKSQDSNGYYYFNWVPNENYDHKAVSRTIDNKENIYGDKAYVNRAGGGMAIGINSQVTPEYNSILVNSTDLKTNYTAELSMALGYAAKALNSDSIAIGQFTEVLGQDSVAMGFGAYIGKQKQTTGEKPTSIYESGFK